MAISKIKKGDIFYCNNRVVKFVVALDMNNFQVQDLSTGEYITVTPSALDFKVEPSETETAKQRQDLTTFSQEELNLATRRFKILSEIVGESDKLICTTSEAMNRLAVSRAQLFRLIKKFDRNSSFVTLIRDARGRKRATSLLSPQVDSIIKEIIEQQYKGAGASKIEVAEKVRKLCKNAGLKPPSAGAVYLRINRTDPKKISQQLYGSEKADQDHKVRGGKKPVGAPLELVEMDHCYLDIIIVDEEYRQPLARPWLCVAIDVYSRSILGFYLTLNAPCAMNVALCISHAMLPKNQWLHDLQITDFDYPYYGIFKFLGVDNGSEFRNNALINGCNKYKVEILWRKRVHHGAHIERWNGTLMQKMRGLPGATLNSVKEREKYSNIPPPAMTLKETKCWLIEKLNVYHKEKHEGLGTSPLYKWDKYFKDSKGRITLPEMVIDKKQLLLDFMPYKTCTLHRSGLKLETIEYYSPAILRFSQGTKFIVKYDPSSMRRVWARPVDEDNYIELTYSDVSRPDISLAEYKRARKKLTQDSDRYVNEQEVWASVERSNAIVQNSIKQTKQVRTLKEKKLVDRSEPLRRVLSESSQSNYSHVSDALDYDAPPPAYDLEMD